MPDAKVIVLDPGHGGSNEGLNYKGFIEKDMNLIVANAMKDALSQYDNVEVYITNPEKKDMSLKERAEYAQSVGADVMICLHFNMSEEHNMFGSEVWIPSTGMGYAKMHSLGDIFIDQFAEQGLTVRGVKTRLNDEGMDYYGIIRESEQVGVPCVLVEHAYADHDRDFEFIDGNQKLMDLGVLDAQAVAKYFRLKSGSLGTDYKDFVKNGYYAPEEAVAGDSTPPEEAQLIWLGEEGSYMADDEQTFLIGATDEESLIVYYNYSLDGGETWSEVFPFERGLTQMEITIPAVYPGSKVVARIYNGHYLYTETNTIAFTPLDLPEKETPAPVDETVKQEPEAAAAEPEPEKPDTTQQSVEQPAETGGSGPFLFCGFGIFLSAMLFLAAFFTYKMGKNSRGMAKKERLLFISAICVLLISVTATGVVTVRHFTAGSAVETATLEDASDALEPEEPLAADIPETADDEAEAEEEKEPWPPEPFELTLDGENGSKKELPKKLSLLPEEEDMTVIYDIAEGYLKVPLLREVTPNSLKLSAFSGKDLSMRYDGGDRHAVIGIDVSKFQGDIDFESVREAGVEFVIIRLGLRGYESGELVMDDRFYENLEKAQEAGLGTGVYFFSAAINEEEAREEADFVLQSIDGYGTDMPVVFDTEPIVHDTARTDDLTPNQLTAITKAFCAQVSNYGYRPMIYANAKRFTTVLRLEELSEYDLWLADYRESPDFPYAIKMWQFTEHGSVPGIGGEVDIDLYFLD